MINICRPIILFNKQIPMREDKLECDYVVLGEYDGISVRDNIFSGKTEVRFSDLWSNLVQETKELQGLYTKHILYAFRSENMDQEGIPDTRFFAPSELPFFFFVMLQYKENGFNTEYWGKHIEACIHRFYSDVMAITYLTLDSTDIILLLKTKTYDIGRKIINDLHHEENVYKISDATLTLNYSFSIVGFSKKVLEEKSDFQQFDGEIAEVIFNAIEAKPGSIQELYTKLSEEVKPSKPIELYEKLGNDDEVLVWRQANWASLLKLYRGDNKGLMLNEHPLYNSTVYSIATGIRAAKSQVPNTNPPALRLVQDVTEEICMKERSENIQGVCNKYRSLIKENMPTLPCSDQELTDFREIEENVTLAKTLLQLLNSLDKFETSQFPKYIFISIFEPLKQFIRLLYRKKIPRDNHTDLEFLNAISMLIQNSDDADRNFFQTPDFNAGIYNAPVKLEAFYSAYIYYVTELYNSMNLPTDPKYHYKFLLCPWIQNQTNSLLIFPDSPPGDRTILIKIPERLLFDPETLIIILGHEVGHYVGEHIRMREVRYEEARTIIILGIIQQWCDDSKLQPFITGKTKQRWKKFLEEKFDEEREQYDRENLKQENCADESEYRRRQLHASYMRVAFKNIFYNVLETNSEALYQIMLDTYMEEYNQNMQDVIQKYVDYQKFWLETGEDLKELQNRVYQSQKAWNQAMISLIGIRSALLYVMIDNVIDIFVECFADLISILTLDLTPEQYLESFSKTVGPITTAALIIRVNFVVEAMNTFAIRTQNEGEYEFKISWFNAWKELYNRFGSFPEEKASLINSLLKTMQFYEQNKEEEIRFLNKETKLYREYRIFENREVWVCIIKYLCRCKWECEKQFSEKKPSNSKNDLKALYEKLCQIDSIADIVKNMDDLIYQYAAYVFREKE